MAREFIVRIPRASALRFDWLSLQAIATNTSYRFVGLSPMSKVLADSSFSFYSQIERFIGAGDSLTDEEIDDIKASVARLMIELERPMFIGMILPYAGLSVPSGALACDGSSYFRVDYPLLYEHLIGTDYIEDDETFHVPGFDGRTIIQAGSIATGTMLGEAEHTLTVAELAQHNHLYTPPVINVDLESPGAPDIFAAGVGAPAVTGMQGGDMPHNNMQPSIAFNFCIVSGGLT